MTQNLFLVPDILVLLLAAINDYLIADPLKWIHPVQIMGWSIKRISSLIIDYARYKWQRRLGGICLGLIVIIGSGGGGWLIIELAHQLNNYLGLMSEVVLLASCFAARSLRLAAENVLQALTSEKLELARSRLSMYVGRDTKNLSPAEIHRAVLETVAENAIDGVTAPLFYALIGALIPGVGSVPCALAYKAASTLDSMIGYHHQPYTDVGWFSAQLEDRLTWLPCRLTVLTLACCSRKPLEILAICRRDGNQDPSPNSGWSESVYAAILQVQLGGTNSYQGIIKQKPLLGNPVDPISPDKIQQALQLTRYCFLLWLAIGISLLAFTG